MCGSIEGVPRIWVRQSHYSSLWQHWSGLQGLKTRGGQVGEYWHSPGDGEWESELAVGSRGGEVRIDLREIQVVETAELGGWSDSRRLQRWTHQGWMAPRLLTWDPGLMLVLSASEGCRRKRNFMVALRSRLLRALSLMATICSRPCSNRSSGDGCGRQSTKELISLLFVVQMTSKALVRSHPELEQPAFTSHREKCSFKASKGSDPIGRSQCLPLIVGGDGGDGGNGGGGSAQRY